MRRYAPDKPQLMSERDDGDYFFRHDVRFLLGRCLDALESDVEAARQKLADNNGYPARQGRYKRWAEDSAALYEEVKAILKD